VVSRKNGNGNRFFIMGMGGNGNGNGFMGMGGNGNRNSPSRTPPPCSLLKTYLYYVQCYALHWTDNNVLLSYTGFAYA